MDDSWSLYDTQGDTHVNVESAFVLVCKFAVETETSMLMLA